MWQATLIIGGRKEYVTFPCGSINEPVLRTVVNAIAFSQYGGGYRIGEILEQGTLDPIRYA